MSCSRALTPLASVVAESAILALNAVAWQLAYKAWATLSSWDKVLPFVGGAALTGFADSSVSSLALLAKDCGGFMGDVYYSKSDYLKMTFSNALIAALWQPLVVLGVYLSVLTGNAASSIGTYVLTGSMVFLGNVGMAATASCIMRQGLAPNPYSLPLAELFFYMTGPLPLVGSDSGLDNREIAYAGAFAFAGAALGLGIEKTIQSVRVCLRNRRQSLLQDAGPKAQLLPREESDSNISL